jgi:hypothetical protein
LHAPQNCTARQRVAIIVPYRNRPTQLESLLDHLNPILERQQLEFQVFIVNQLEDGTFNRAKLMNAGVKYLKESLKEQNYDVFARLFVFKLNRSKARSSGTATSFTTSIFCSRTTAVCTDAPTTTHGISPPQLINTATRYN